jgi:hypothetical protein
MFKWLFIYWYNVIDTPSNQIALNIWTYVNLRYFKAKVSSYILYFVLSLNNLKFKKLKIFYKVLSFEYFYLRLINFIIFFFFFFSIIGFIY